MLCLERKCYGGKRGGSRDDSLVNKVHTNYLNEYKDWTAPIDMSMYL